MSEENNNNTQLSDSTLEAKKSFGVRPAGSIAKSQGAVKSFNSFKTNVKPGERRSGSTFGSFNKRSNRDSRRQKEEDHSNLESQVIVVRRVTRVVKGGKRMRFSALVVVGDKAGKVGYGLKKGLDFQDAVAKATKKAQDNLIKININKDGSIDFPSLNKFKACELMLKPAKSGTGLIAGGFIRPVLELAGVQNIYSKIITSRNKVSGVQATFEALKKYKVTK